MCLLGPGSLVPRRLWALASRSGWRWARLPDFDSNLEGPKRHINARILQSMVSSIPLILGLGTRMWDPYGPLLWVVTKFGYVVKAYLNNVFPNIEASWALWRFNSKGTPSGDEFLGELFPKNPKASGAPNLEPARSQPTAAKLNQVSWTRQFLWGPTCVHSGWTNTKRRVHVAKFIRCCSGPVAHGFASGWLVIITDEPWRRTSYIQALDLVTGKFEHNFGIPAVRMITGIEANSHLLNQPRLAMLLLFRATNKWHQPWATCACARPGAKPGVSSYGHKCLAVA